MNSIRGLARVGQLSVRNARTFMEDNSKLPKGLHPRFYKLKADQQLYQQPDGLPVHLKRGFRDKFLLYLMYGMSGVGLAACFQFYYSLP